MATDIIARGMITEYKSGTNIDFKENEDGSVTISASGDVSSEDTVARDTIDNHKLDKNNPHNVTAEQVGLGNVNNTADLDKPISTAVQTALDDKANTKHTHKKSDITDFPNSLPANGGDADTVNGFGVAEYVTTLPEGEYYTEAARINTRDKKIESCDTSNLKVGLADYATNADYAINSNTVNNHTVDSDVPANAVFTDTTNSDVTIVGNPVQLDGLQGGVPFSEMIVKGKNLIPFPYYDSNSKTQNGITFTVNADGTVTANGTSTDIAYFYIAMYAKIVKKGVRYAISGCPEGANADTYRIFINERKSDGTSNGIFIADFNDNKSFTVSDNCDSIHIAIQIRSGVTVDNLVFRPQLELGDTATSYEPPITGRELQVNVSGKNLLQKMTDKTIGGLHYSPNGDGSVSVTGTQTAENYPGITSTSGMLLKAGKYTLSGGTERLQITALDVGTNTVIARSKIAPATFSIDNDKYIRIYVYSSGAYNSQTFDDVLYPQLEIGTAATEYEPYHGSATTIIPTSNPYTIPNDIRQQEGLNNISVSEGEISVVGVRKNAALKKIWDETGMDLLFDGVTSANNPAVVDLANYKFVEICHTMTANEKTYPTNIRLSLDNYLSSASTITTPISNSTINTIHTEEGTVSSLYAISAAGSNMNNTKIYGIK